MLIVFDLDDTLYKERDYLLSAYRRIARIISERHPSQDADRLYRRMRRSRDAFSTLSASLPASWPESDISWMVHICRTHMPDISLTQDIARTLTQLRAKGHTLALITDGRSGTQRHKIDALGLTRWFEPELISISDEIGAEKTQQLPFRRMMDLTPHHTSRVYVADNLHKDFRWPKALGWQTVCLRDNGRNIFPQNPDEHHTDYQPDIIISTLSELVGLLP